MKAGRERVVFDKARHLQRMALFWARSEVCPLDLLVGPSREQRSTHVGYSIGSSARGLGDGSINP